MRDPGRVDGLSPELHATRVLRAYGFSVGECSCTAISLPYDTGGAAAQWTCPRAKAEAEILAAKREWYRRMEMHGDPRD